MIATLISLSALAVMIVATQFVPTAGEMQSSFDQAQKFYASGAYDQAINNYEHVVESSSDLLQMDSVRVAVGEIEAPLQEVAPYQIGNSYLKMAEERLERGAKTRDPEEREAHVTEARALLKTAAESFVTAESGASVPSLRALARHQAITCWYKMEEYERTIEGARLLMERYPNSRQVEPSMYDIGWSYYEMGDYTRSIDAFEALVDQFPSGYRSNRALFQIGESYFKLERYAEAVRPYQRLVDAQRIGHMSEREILTMNREKLAGLVDETALEIAAKALIRIGVCYEKLGNYEQAVEAFRTVATQFADERRLAEEAYLREADMHYSRGDFESTIAVYHRAIEAAYDPFAKARIQLLLANRYFETEHYADAVREYNLYRNVYGERATQVGLPLDGVGLQIARAWLGEAEQQSGGEQLEAYRLAEIEMRRTLTLFEYSFYEVELKFNLALALQQQDDEATAEETLTLFQEVADAPAAGGYRQSALFQIARIHRSRQEFEQTEAVYRQLIDELEDKPEADIARFELGILQRERQAWQAAVEEYLQVRPEAPLFARSRLEAGQLLLQQSDLTRAIEVLAVGAEAETAPESKAIFQYLLGAALSRQGDNESAISRFAAAIAAADPSFVERPIYARGSSLYKLGRFDEAISDLDRTWSDSSLAIAAPRLLAAAFTSAGRTDNALQAYRDLVHATKTPLERAELLLALAEISFRQGRNSEAVAACEELMELSFEEASLPEERPYYIREKALWLRADASLRLGSFEQVAADADTGLAAYTDGFYTPDFLFLGGAAALQLERYEEAQVKLTQAMERFPDYANLGDVYYYLGYAYFYQTYFDRAIPYFATVVEKFPEFGAAPDALFRIGESRYNLGRYGEAQQDYQKVIERYPRSPLRESALYNIAWCLMEISSTGDSEGELEDVKEAFRAYVEQYPQGQDVQTARYTLAEISFNEGDYERAHELFSRIVEDFPGSPAAGEAETVLPELREALAYREYSAILEVFEQAKEEASGPLFRTAIQRFEEIWIQYPTTMGGIAAKVNVGVCHQRLKEWQDAVETFDLIIAEGEKGNPKVTDQVLGFVEERRGTIARKHL